MRQIAWAGSPKVRADRSATSASCLIMPLWASGSTSVKASAAALPGTCFLADTGTVEDCDVVARLDEIRRGAYTDDAGADNGDLPAVAAQSRRLRLKYRGGAGSGCTGCGKVRQVGVAHSRAIPAKCVVVLHLELRKQGDRTISQSGEKRNRSKFGAILSVPRRAWEATLRTGLRRQRRGVPTR